MAKTLYKVYEVGNVQATLDVSDGTHELRYIGEATASNPRAAAREVISEPRADTEYVAIPERNITTVTPKFKPSMWSWTS